MERRVGIRQLRDAPRLDGAAFAAAVAALAVALLLRALLVAPALPTPPTSRSVPAVAASLSGLRALPLGAQAVISRTLGADDPGFRFRALSGDARGVIAGGMRARLARGALWLSAPGGRLGLVPSPRAPAAWYAAGPLGLEQGFDVARPVRTGRLTISLALGGTVLPQLAGGVVTFRSGDETVFRYGALAASDATGRVLRAWFTLAHRRLVIHVAARGARYPVRIDPFVQAAELTATSPAARAGFGDAVAVSGSTIAVGAPAATANGADQGAVYVFSESGASWSAAPSVVELTEPSSNTTVDNFGISVALSGTTLVAGASKASNGDGAAWVFTEPAGGWSSGTVGTPAELTASDGEPGGGFGFAVATDGSTVIAGARRVFGDLAQPDIYVFQEPGAGWTSESGDTESGDTELITGADASLAGHALAVSGSVVAAGAYGEGVGDEEGTVYLFQHWTANQQTPPTATLTAPDAAANDELGWSIALSGSTLVAGAPQQGAGPGKVLVWTEPAGGWSATPAAPAVLTATNGATGDELGAAVGVETSVSPETVVAAAPGAQSSQGALDVFTEPTSGWSGSIGPAQQLTAADGSAGDQLGGEVGSTGALAGSGAVAIDGATIVAGAADYASQAGAVYVFTDTTATTTTTVPALQKQPRASGTGRAGQRLTCSHGSWSGSPTGYLYQWNRAGTPIAGSTGASYVVQATDEQLSLTCTVTATDVVGKSVPATSNAIDIAVPKVKGCPAATGRLSGTTLGRLHLGITRAQARRAFTHSSDRGQHYEDFFCLTPIGVRVGYGSPALLTTLPRSHRARYADRVVWASTSSAYYAIDGIRSGATIIAASARLHPGAPFQIGLNTWYLASTGAATAVLKVRHGIVEEIGIAQRALTTTRATQLAFLRSFS